MPNPKLDSLLRSIVACIGRNTLNPEISWNEPDFQFIVAVDPRDQGRFIGKDGHNYWAMNALFWYAGLAQIQHTVQLKLLNPDKPVAFGPRPFQKNTSWNQERVQNMIQEILAACFKTDPKFTISIPQTGVANVTIYLDKYLQMPLVDPDFKRAISTVIYSGGKADGCSIQTEIKWE